jgi:hypothetical protein
MISLVLFFRKPGVTDGSGVNLLHRPVTILLQVQPEDPLS